MDFIEGDESGVKVGLVDVVKGDRPDVSEGFVEVFGIHVHYFV